MGKVTQATGELTFFSYLPPQQIKTVKTNETLLNQGSYLSQDKAFLTAQLFDGSWVRLGPESKFSVEFDPTSKHITIYLFKGSLKVLFSTQMNKLQAQKLIVKSGDALFETSEGKFSVVRNSLSDSTSVYVEKGLVVAEQSHLGEKKDVELVHTNEVAEVKDRGADILPAHKISEKEMSYLKSNSHLKFKKSKI